MSDLLAVLRLQIDWGADEALAEAPLDRLSAPPTPPAGQARLPPRLSGTLPRVATGSTSASRAEAAAAAADSPAALVAALAAFEGCALRDTASTLVFAEGDPAAATMLVGDVPGQDEDRAGRPFAGAGGLLLDRMLASIGLTRQEDVSLAMLVPWRPPGGRPPTEAEIALCLPFLRRYVALAAPRRLVMFGPLVARALALAGAGAGRRRTRSGWTEIAVPGLAAPLPALLMTNPAALLENPVGRRQAWTDLRLLRRALDRDLAES